MVGPPLGPMLAIGTRPDVLGRGELRPRPKAEVAEPDQEQHRPKVREQVDGQVARGPARRNDATPTKTQRAEAGSTYPTHRARDGSLTNGTARSTAPTSQASSPRANATTNPEGVGDEPATSRGACSASHGSTSAP